MSAHPKPLEMASEAKPWAGKPYASPKNRRDQDESMYASGVVAERARVAAWLRAFVEDPHHPVTAAWLADELEGKVSS